MDISPITKGLTFPALDRFVHTWDLARARGVEVEIPEDAVALAHSLIDTVPTEQVRSPGVLDQRMSGSRRSNPYR